MQSVFIIEDDFHAEPHGEYPTLADAVAELKRLSLIPWNEPPNQAPCTNWQTCGRTYAIIEYDTSSTPWLEINNIAGLDIRASGTIFNEALL